MVYSCMQVTYKPWGKNQPNNYKEQDCGEINYPTIAERMWSDGRCEAEFKFICEKFTG